MVIEEIRENLVRATPADGRRLVNADGRTVAEGEVYAPSTEALAAWAEMDASEAGSLASEWDAEDGPASEWDAEDGPASRMAEARHAIDGSAAQSG